MGGPATFGALLRSHRHAAALTIEELSDASGVSVRAIGDMERGRSRAPQRRTVAALAGALGLSPEERRALEDAVRTGRRRRSRAPLNELPRGVRDFTGRTGELAALSRLAESAADPGPTVTVVVSGGPGLGKTALALRAAERLADAFPDGRLFVDLRGMDESPLTPADALARLLRGLGVVDRHVPQDPHERAGHYRALMRDLRTLIILDNAADEAQVRPLLPADGPGMVVVTSRRTLAGLEGVHHLPLAELSPAEAVGLLQKIITAVRPAADAELDQIARLCGNLPLALRIVATRLLSRPSWTAAHMADRLADEERRLQALSAGDLHVATAFMLSYRQLSDEARLTFRRLALIPGPHFDAAPAAVLTCGDPRVSEDALDELVELGLLQSPYPTRYRLHDLVRLFARDRLLAEEAPQAHRAARDKLENWLLDTAVTAGRWFEPGYGAPPADPGRLVALDTPAEAQAWLETESIHWLPALRAAAAAGRHRQVIDTAEAMHWFSDRWIHWGHWSEVFGLARSAARALGDTRVEATHLNYLSWAASTAEGRPRDGLAHALEALELARAARDRAQEAWALAYASYATRDLGDWEQVAAHARQAAEIFASIDDKEGYPQAVNVLGDALRNLGRPDEALHHHLTLLATLRAPGYGGSPGVREFSLGLTLRRVGEDYAALDRWDEAADHYAQAIPPLRDQGIVSGVPVVAQMLGDALRRLGRLDEARRAFQTALDGYLQIGEDIQAAEVRKELTDLPAG
ncbi:XRE family transcriptional regulator [Actinomadura kijaniata]|uniref:Tetratricopeptide (TPR) repeat protein/transcriptional regulator with XRE-family HTH domain n=1 Tax=Actinomadura namibiensis TaxID=182080 RepID=A0A7W3LYM2_ACTNM|nr:XRE family transcriptional regulator [Actinomadura namibiensis]MBA8956780.1 tetratricopeptide (TPR) repeat protein/transcriptional regulator with XRE-family HTH domain [Actinomadura namibiensis]